MNLDQALHIFIVECRELLVDMENALLSVAHAETKTEMVNAIFRGAHTIKGSAGLFGLDRIVEFTHVLESVLDQVREGKIEIADQLLNLMLSCCDHIGTLVNAAEAGQIEVDPAILERGVPLTDQLQAYLDGTNPAGSEDTISQYEHDDAEQIPGQIERIDNARADHAINGHGHWHISLRFANNVLRNGMDPLSFIHYLAKVGTIVGIVTLIDAIPEIETMDPESCYLGFEIDFNSAADKATIENVFEFVRDDCHIQILSPQSKVSDYLQLIESMTEQAHLVGAILLRCGIITEDELGRVLPAQPKVALPAQSIGVTLVEQARLQPSVLDAALTKQNQIKEEKVQENRSIRVDADKLDQLINLVGELIIAGAAVNLVAHRAQNAELQEYMSTLTGLVEEVRDSALQLRMVKIGATFSRFQRVVHDVSREIGKDIALVVSGADTELDKTVVEKIGDPLTHLVRNSIDHGIESAELRAANGKPAQGVVKLNAYHDSGSIVIEVSDDGGGLKRDRILAKGIERGLVEEGRTLSDADIFNLIFEPGFSTSEQITNLSGRGVGMDVVKRNIIALRGSVGIKSDEGIGTTVTVRLPLTLAIINGFMVALGKSVFVIPLDMIEECVEFSTDPGNNYTNLRGQVLPFIRLRNMFDVQGAAGRRESIVVVNYGGKKAGLIVDALLGEFQTVIKPLGQVFSQIQGISGSSILGSGEVALILDIPALLNNIEGNAKRQFAA